MGFASVNSMLLPKYLSSILLAVLSAKLYITRRFGVTMAICALSSAVMLNTPYPTNGMFTLLRVGIPCCSSIRKIPLPVVATYFTPLMYASPAISISPMWIGSDSPCLGSRYSPLSVQMAMVSENDVMSRT